MKYLLNMIICVLSFTVLTANGDGNTQKSETSCSFDEHTIVVKFNSDPQLDTDGKNTVFSKVNAILNEYNGIELNYAITNSQQSNLMNKSLVENICYIQFSDVIDLKKICEEVAQLDEVVYAEQMRIYQHDDVPNDPSHAGM